MQQKDANNNEHIIFMLIGGLIKKYATIIPIPVNNKRYFIII